jgi:hypothetical protein
VKRRFTVTTVLRNCFLDRLKSHSILDSESLDSHLLARFIEHCDGGAFETLVRRHGPMVYSANSPTQDKVLTFFQKSRNPSVLAGIHWHSWVEIQIGGGEMQK